MLEKMWHEARKQERKIRGMLVDYKRRAERRREYYEKIKQDPTQFIQLHGRPVKIHLDPAVAYAAEAPGSMMPWRGDADSMIDRFDVRAHLDDLPPASSAPTRLTAEEDWEERQANYERYRILIQNDFLAIKEEKFLHQIRLEEQYGPIVNKSIEEEKKALAPKKAAIAFTYTEEPEEEPKEKGGASGADTLSQEAIEEAAEATDEESDSDIDLDLTVDVMSLSNTQQQEMNLSGVEYGLNQDDFMSLISRDLQEAEELRVAKEHEDEKAMYSGRKSRKERRALKKKHMDRKLSPPSYAARASPTYAPYRRSSSRSKSRSPTPPAASTIKFITSFGGESDGAGTDEEGVTGVIILPRSDRSARDRRTNRWDQRGGEGGGAGGSGTSAHPPSSTKKRRHSPRSRSRSRSGSSGHSRRRHRSRHSRSHSHTRHRYTRSRSKSRDRDRDRHHSYKKSRSSHRYSRSRSKSHSRSKSVGRKSPSPAPKSVGGGSSVGPTQPSPDPPARLPSPPRRRYYGRRGQDSNSDSVSECDSEEQSNSSTNTLLNSANPGTKTNIMVAPATVGNGSSAAKEVSKLTPQERLKKKTQALLKKQFKADKRLERERAEKAEQERQDREEELREMAIRLRRREREKRHRLQGEDSSSEGSHSRSRSHSGSRSESRSSSRSKSRPRSKSHQRSLSRSKSPLPQKQCGRWGDGGRGRERNASAEWGRETHSRQWGASSSHWDTPDRYRDSYRRRSRSYSPAGRWEREREHHLAGRRSRSRSRGRDYGSTSSGMGSPGFRRKTFRDYDRDWDREGSRGGESYRDYQHGYQRDYQHGYQRDYHHRPPHHHHREPPPEHPRDRPPHRDHPRRPNHSYPEDDRDDGGRIGRIRLVDY